MIAVRNGPERMPSGYVWHAEVDMDRILPTVTDEPGNALSVQLNTSLMIHWFGTVGFGLQCPPDSALEASGDIRPGRGGDRANNITQPLDTNRNGRGLRILESYAFNMTTEEVQLKKGTRRLQLKNAMQAKFDHILVPIAEQLIVPEQRKNITFTAFFANTMFHEVAHGLGIKQVIGTGQTVRGALKEHASALEEGKADILGLYMIRQLLEKGAIDEGTLEDYYTTFMAGIFRSVRFGASSAHGKANMVRFNYFQEQGAFERNEQGLYSINMEKMSEAIDSLSKLILTLQGNGDYEGVAKLVAEKGLIKADLQSDLAKLTSANIPVDIVFKQGKKVLGL